MLMWILFGLLGIIAAFWIAGLVIKLRVEKLWPPVGDFADIDGMSIHYVDVDAGNDPELPPIIFLHGSNGNLRDQMAPLRQLFEGRARMVFVDRPGHGYSTRKSRGYCDPSLQAQVIAGLMTHLGIEKAIICGHSLGGSITVAFGVHHPERLVGLMFLAPATHPWSDGVDWYYNLANRPWIGPLFSFVIAPVIGWLKYSSGIRAVFDPNTVPENYEQVSATRIALRGQQFYYNALDVANLNANVTRLSPRYPEISVPVVIITGDSDDIVMADIHSRGLERDIEGAELIFMPGMGHKPDYLALDEIVAGIDRIVVRAKPSIEH